MAIIGSGFLGLTLALRLAERGNQVTIFESADEIGGLASAWNIGDVIWDKHYHVTLLSDSFTRKIIRDLRLENEFNWVETKTGVYTDGQLVSMSNTFEFLKFPPLGALSKLRLGATIFYASRVKNWKALEKIPVEKWLTRLSGKRTFEKIWKPLLKAKLGEAYRETSAAFIWATIQRMYAARNSGLKKEMFGYVRGGYARVLQRFGEVLKTKGVEIHLNSRVQQVTKAGHKITVFASGSTETYKAQIQFESDEAFSDVSVRSAAADIDSGDFDSVILTCPSNVAAQIVPQLTPDERRKSDDIKYQGIICASLLLKKSLSEFYVTNITDETPFTGIIEMSALVDKKEFGGKALVYLPKYAAPDDKIFQKSDVEIEELFLGKIEEMYPDFNQDDVEAFRVSRVRQVFPIPTLNYSDRLPQVKTSLENVYVINSSQITNGTLNVNETVQSAERFIADYFKD